MTITIEAKPRGGYTIRDGSGFFWTPNTDDAVSYIRELFLAQITAEIAEARDGRIDHIRVLSGPCPTCHYTAADCYGREL